MSDPSVVLAVFLVCTLIFGGVGILIPQIVGPRNPGGEKQRPYECGVVMGGDPWRDVKIQFYLFALVFLVFDVEVLFLFPWAVIFKDAGLLGFIEMMIFIGLLALGWAFAWKAKALEWE